MTLNKKIEEDLKRVLSYEISSNNDTKKILESGHFATSEVNILQYVSKNYDVQRYDYFSDFDKYKSSTNGKK